MTRKANPDVFDRASALWSVGGDRDFLAEVAGLFQAAWPALLREIRAGLAAGDFDAVAVSAHLVEAAAKNISARNVRESAHRLEALACERALDACRVACLNLEHDVEILTPYLARFQSSNSKKV